MSNCVLIGAAGFVVPRHLKAMKETGLNLIAALDPHDSVGILDSYFPKCSFFTEFERFDRFCDKEIRKGNQIDYVVVCSPNYLHDAHTRFGLRIGADVICEKPVVLNSHNLHALMEMEKETGRKVYTILQLRLSSILMSLKDELVNTRNNEVFIRYITPRGNWYFNSWKGDVSKSGGLATNIGIHLFDVMTWLFGQQIKNIVSVPLQQKIGVELVLKDFGTISGNVKLERANVSFFLSVEGSDPIRSITINNRTVDFNSGFTELHTKSYEEILNGRGFGLSEALPSIEICEVIRKLNPRYSIQG